ncbi:hypothetical protein TorRG33x02_260060 [Trema orientale]|uniref:NAC domain containing protein n=1 Tax=Trema orientale TaxID=63057 RepID=A0A2P5D797_TREOI|nr:hypothetical protein TorRG33x02_260060 [Trema orientale]
MESEMYKFQLDRNRREGNYFSRKAGDGYWKFHGSEPIIMDETTATIRHVKHTEGLGPFSSTIRYVRLMTKGHSNGRPHRKDIVKDRELGAVQDLSKLKEEGEYFVLINVTTS